jgi:hypothetical protein
MQMRCFVDSSDAITFFNNSIAEFCRQQNIPPGEILLMERRRDLELIKCRMNLSPAWEIIRDTLFADSSNYSKVRAVSSSIDKFRKDRSEAYYHTPVAYVHSTDPAALQPCDPLTMYGITVFKKPIFATEKDWRDEAETELTRSVAKSVKAALGRGPQHVRTTLLDNHAVYIISGLIASSVLSCSDLQIEYHYRQSIGYILERSLNEADTGTVRTGEKVIAIDWANNKIVVIAPIIRDAPVK